MGLPSNPSPARSAACRKRCTPGSASMRSMTASVRASRRLKSSASKSWSERCANCARPTDPEAGQRVFRPGGARPPHQVPEGLRRPASPAVRGRVDLSRHADRPVGVLASPRPAGTTQRSAHAARSAMRAWCLWFSVCGKPTSRSTGLTRSGASSTREGVAVARCTVERLMRQKGLQGVRRGAGVAHHRP